MSRMMELKVNGRFPLQHEDRRSLLSWAVIQKFSMTQTSLSTSSWSESQAKLWMRMWNS